MTPDLPSPISKRPVVPVASTSGPEGHRVVAALLPSNNPELFGLDGPKADHFRYSRSKERFVLAMSNQEILKRMGRDGTAQLGDPGIMKQVRLDDFEQMLAEIAYLEPRYSRDLTPLRVLLKRFDSRGRLDVLEQEFLRELLEFFILRRPSGHVMEVGSPRNTYASFWPHLHPEGIWSINPEGKIGADSEGVFFMNPEGTIFFRSRHFLQRRLDKGLYELEDVGDGHKCTSPVAVVDVYYHGTPPRLRSELIEEVSFSYFDFPESTGMLALHLHTMAKLGLIVGQPLLKLVCENTRYIALDG